VQRLFCLSNKPRGFARNLALEKSFLAPRLNASTRSSAHSGVGIAVIGNLTRMLELPLPVKSVAFFSTSFFPPRGLKWGVLFAALPPNPKGEILGLILKYSSPHDMH